MSWGTVVDMICSDPRDPETIPRAYGTDYARFSTKHTTFVPSQYFPSLFCYKLKDEKKRESKELSGNNGMVSSEN